MLRHLVPVVVVLATASSTASAAPPACEAGPAVALTGASCGELQPPRLSCRAPADVEGALAQPSASTVQRAVDIFSWQQLIALHWPAAPGRRGAPAADQPLAGPGPRVWETWKEAYEIYLPGGRKPAPWNTPQTLPAACGGRARALARVTKVSDVVDQALQALPADPTLPVTLKDQRGRLVRYEIRLNQTLFDYLVRRRLHDGRVQARAAEIDFPDGSQLVKVAWRELDDGDAGDFIRAEACVCTEAGACAVKRMGMAGFHLMTKTAAAPRWIWSTFEHVDNVVSRDPGVVAPLNDPGCPAERCPPNVQTPDGVPTQVRRVIPVPSQAPRCDLPDAAVDDVAGLNRDVQRALRDAGSPLAGYELVGAQWPLRGTPRPAILANTTMETFSQDTSSCMGCHAMARTLRPDRTVAADFSFTLNNAEPRPAGARCVNVEASESCDERSLGAPPVAPPARYTAPQWASVRLGHEVATRTFELLGASGVVGNKLHCASCHLDAGGNPDAAWWVNMRTVYGLASLQARINSCFTHSMAGRALCAPGVDCDDNPHMRGLIAYMDWLTASYRTQHRARKVPRGFPGDGNPEAQRPGDATRGRAVFAQRCAFCHGRDGQGRYAHDTYFRPALWGPGSYAASAGMAKPATLAAFLQANMPYTSGGLLSWSDARDLAAYIDSQCRPGAACTP